MSAKKNDSGKLAVNTVVGKDSLLEGTFEIEEGIRVDGSLKGQLVSSGTLVVGSSGIVEADPIRVRDAIIAGRLTGKLVATRRVKLESSAVLTGDITAQVLIIEEGAVFKGISDAGDQQEVKVPASPQPERVEEVRKAAD
jgi:cytoskeletal protein CcmA (bactofilin family)